MFNTYNPVDLTFHENGFSFRIHGDKQCVEWAMVREIVGYRRPLDSGDDLLCLGIRFGNGREYMEVNEDMDAYSALVAQLHDVFPGIKHSWWKEIASWYGQNRITIYGIGLNEKSPAENYLTRPRKKVRLTRRKMVRWLYGAAALVLLAAVQLAAVGLIARWAHATWDDILAVTLLPFLLVIFSCRYWGVPGLFFIQMTGFYLAQLILVLIFDIGSASLMGKFLAFRFSYLLVPGLEILLAMGVLLLPNRRAMGRVR